MTSQGEGAFCSSCLGPGRSPTLTLRRIPVSPIESKYVENKTYWSRYPGDQTPALREAHAGRSTEFADEAEWFRSVKHDFPRYLPFLKEKCGSSSSGASSRSGPGEPG